MDVSNIARTSCARLAVHSYALARAAIPIASVAATSEACYILDLRNRVWDKLTPHFFFAGVALFSKEYQIFKYICITGALQHICNTGAPDNIANYIFDQKKKVWVNLTPYFYLAGAVLHSKEPLIFNYVCIAGALHAIHFYFFPPPYLKDIIGNQKECRVEPTCIDNFHEVKV